MVTHVMSQKLTVGTEHRFRIPKIIDITPSFSAGLNTPFDSYPYLSLEPEIRLSGSYFFGLDWEIDALLTTEIYPDTLKTVYYPYGYGMIGFEFFRFYGPDNLRIIVSAEDFFSPEIRPDENDYFFQNSFKAGVSLRYRSLIPSAGFVYQTEWAAQPYLLYADRPGFYAGLSWSDQKIFISGEYQGRYDQVDHLWNHRIEASIRLRWNLPLQKEKSSDQNF
jgi:hypothetical protein